MFKDIFTEPKDFIKAQCVESVEIRSLNTGRNGSEKPPYLDTFHIMDIILVHDDLNFSSSVEVKANLRISAPIEA